MSSRGALAMTAAVILLAMPSVGYSAGSSSPGLGEMFNTEQTANLQIRCDKLKDQFDAAVKGKSTTAAIDVAKKLRARAAKDCDEESSTIFVQNGVKEMKQALAEIGVTPMD